MEAKPSSLFTSYCVGLFGIIAALAIALAYAGESPKLTHVLILGLLFAIEDNMDVDLGDGVGLSASIMVVIAAIVFFQDSAPMLGPLLVGMKMEIPVATEVPGVVRELHVEPNNSVQAGDLIALIDES